MSDGPWKRGWKDWWSVGRGWFVRAIFMSGIGAAIGYSLGPRMLAHYPPWVGGLVAGGGAALLWGALTLVASFIRAPGKSLKEKDAAVELANARVRELEANRPRLSACLHEEAERPGNLWLAVTNKGAPAKVWAAITVSGDTTKPCSGVDAIWRHVQAGRCDLGTGETRYITLAVMWAAKLVPQTFNWHVPFNENGEERTTSSKRDGPQTSPEYNPKTDPLASRQRVILEVFSTLASLLPPIRCTVVLLGCDAWEDLTGVGVCDPSILAPPPADPPSSTASG